MEDFVTKEIALLDEHDVVDENGDVVMSLDEDKLHRIANNNNRRVEETGDEVPIIIGHTRDDAPEKAQPEIVGWVKKFSVKPLYNTGRQAVWGVARFMKSKIDKIKQYPRRSVELWLKKMMIDPIALLGATTPERDLGLLKFSAEGGDPSYIPLSPDEESMDPTAGSDDIVQKVMAALEQTDVWQFMKAKMEEEAQAPDGADAQSPDMTDDGSGSIPPPPDGNDSGLPPGQGDLPPEDDEDEPVRKSAVASGTNTFLPGKAKMQAKVLRGEVRKLQAVNHNLGKENEVLRLRLSKAQREKDLIQVETEHGVLLDRDEELEFVAGMNDTQYKGYLERIVKRYQKAPVGGRMYHTAEKSRPVGSVSTRSKQDVDKVVQYAASKGLTYQDALVQIESGEKVF